LLSAITTVPARAGNVVVVGGRVVVVGGKVVVVVVGA